MRKTSKLKLKPKPQVDDDVTEALIGIAVGVAAVALFGGLAVVYGWKALVVSAPL